MNIKIKKTIIVTINRTGKPDAILWDNRRREKMKSTFHFNVAEEANNESYTNKR